VHTPLPYERGLLLLAPLAATGRRPRIVGAFVAGGVNQKTDPLVLPSRFIMVSRLEHRTPSGDGAEMTARPSHPPSFAAASIASDTAVCEYTGLVRVDPPQAELEADDYAYALPVCDPNVVISARDIGGVARLLNHGENPNCELRTVHHEEFLHVVCFTLRRIERGEQCLISYGEPYWRNERRRRKRVQL